MIDITKILKRAWNILWTYRALWVIGLILALTTAGAIPRNNNSGWREDARNNRPGENFEWPSGETIQEAVEQMRQEFNRVNTWERISTSEWNTFLWILVGVVGLAMVLGIVMTIARYVAETATIRMVDEYERSGQKVGIRQGLRYGWSRTAWRLFLINLLISLPVILLVVLGLGIGVGIYFLIVADNPLFSVPGVIAMIGLVFLLIFLGIVLGVLLQLLRDFFWRACALEQVGVGEALRRGWSLVRRNWKSVGLMWLVMIAVRIAWAIALVIAFILSLPLLLVTGIAGLLIGGLPALLVGGLSSLFLGGPLPWMIGAIIGMPLFLVVAFAPMIYFRGLELVYNSTVWTLTYRELNALQSLAAGDNLPQIKIEQLQPGEDDDNEE